MICTTKVLWGIKDCYDAQIQCQIRVKLDVPFSQEYTIEPGKVLGCWKTDPFDRVGLRVEMELRFNMVENEPTPITLQYRNQLGEEEVHSVTVGDGYIWKQVAVATKYELVRVLSQNIGKRIVLTASFKKLVN
jgi:hypothetical protein